MQNNKLYRCNDTIIRILDWKQERVFLIDCKKCTMPKWISAQSISDYKDCTEEELLQETEMKIQNLEELSPESRCFVQNHFSLISCILPFVMDDVKRSAAISRMAEERKVSKQTIRKYLCLYLAYQDISVFAPVEKKKEKELTKEQKNFRWALNKFFYTKDKNSLRTAYTMMLKEKYCNSVGELITPYPTFCQFRYFYRQNKNIQNYYISRNGIKSYQRDNRPLLGDGIQEFASNVGVGMLDATICDIYLVNDMGNLVGRPILTACIDAYSGLCCGYSLSWEGGVYSLRNLMVNVITDKVHWCKKFGISIKSEEWNCDQLPGVLVTDMGSEYKSETFEQISELGITVVNLPSYRPELKGAVEKFFDLIQESYKKYLKGKGVIEPDYQERGAHDYRKEKVCQEYDEYTNLKAKLNVVETFQGSIAAYVAVSGLVLILWRGVSLCVKGILSLSILITYYNMLNYFLTSVTNLVSLQTDIQMAIISADRLNDIWDAPEEKSNGEKSFKDGEIIFKNVSFGYGGGERLFDGINLSIKKGEKVAIIGESGCGKSTIAKLLTSFYNCESGEITISGIPINTYSTEIIRENIMYVPGNGILFEDTVFNNIVLNNDTSLDNVRSICQKLQLDDFIQQLPYGYNTYVDENGSVFSTGQRQRINIARALLRNPKIMILDEATSNLDPLTTKKINDVINTLHGEITCIIIAHKIESIKDCDKIIIMENGTILESGSVDDVLKSEAYVKYML